MRASFGTLLVTLLLTTCTTEEPHTQDTAPGDTASDLSDSAAPDTEPGLDTTGADTAGTDTAGDTTPPRDVPPEGPPSVSETSPADGATDVDRGVAIRVTFNRPIDPESVSIATFQLEPSSSGRYSVDASGLTATFQPLDLLSPDTLYTLTLTTGITSAAGTAMESPFVLSFSTAAGTATPETESRDFGTDRVTVEVAEPDTDRRTYTLSTTAELRDNDPASKSITFVEEAGQPLVRSGSYLFDALFAMSIEETRQNAVESISDGAFNNGQGVPCSCFETGAKWNYVWTRDTAYAVDLGLAMLDATRARNSLDFKLSERKAGGGLQIVQDTGSGGSWPVSTDRVVWALGAWEALKYLEGSERDAFRDRTLTALENTIEQDRRVVFDPADGLYHGEQSFLDWREQSYPSWTAGDTVHIGMSKALSTNVAHLIILRVAAALATETSNPNASRYAGYADDLAAAIVSELWLDDVGQLSAMKTTTLDPTPLHKYELLGASLAVLQDILPAGQDADVVANYPHSTMGPPVLWPQQPLIPIYHNRGIWPFVTAYGLLAARKVGNDAVFDHDLESLIRGAALNLSNMENFEFMSQDPWVNDGDYSGPVVNSRRQLWSVAGYFGAITKGVFGVEVSQTGVAFAPFVTRTLRNDMLASTDTLTLKNLVLRGKRIDLQLVLPTAESGATGGVYDIASVTLNGQAITGEVAWVGLEANNTVVVTLESSASTPASMTVVPDQGNFQDFWAPREPNITGISADTSGITLTFDAGGETGVTFNVYRDGEAVATGLSATAFTDTTATDRDTRTYCYAVESVFASGNHSHHSKPQCYWGSPTRVTELSAYDLRNIGGAWSTDHGRAHIGSWGDSAHALEISVLAPTWTGPHRIQLLYGNGSGSINTGLTCAVKKVIVEEIESGAVVGEGSVMMPQLGDWSRWSESSFVEAELDAAKRYRVRIEDDINMSYFAHFLPYTASCCQGGGSDVFNAANVSGLRLLPISGTAAPRGAGDTVALDGTGDFDAYDVAQTLTPGSTVQSWERFALEWDDDFLYITVVSELFEADYKTFNLYLESASGTLGSATPTTGIDYSNLIPELPFTPTHAITLRKLSEDGSASGPWNGLWRPDSSGWYQQQRFEYGRDVFLAADNHTISVRIPRAALGDPAQLRLAGHMVNAETNNDWKLAVPAGHTPWATGGGTHYTIDLSGAHPVSSWSEL